MRLNWLRPRPYGALADATLEFGDGLTVVYGLNEAGKSTLLSAYADLLCGIPRQTPMGFQVAGRAKLRIHAHITLDDGSTAEVIRTAKNKPNDLVDAVTEQPVTAAVRRALTPAADQQSLNDRFGLNHDRLVAGGAKLLSGRGDLADIVFEARSGADVRALVDRLEDRTEKLFTPRKNSVAELNQAVAACGRLVEELKNTTASAEQVETAATGYKQAQTDLEWSRRAAATLRVEQGRLDKLVAAWPYWEKYRTSRDALLRAQAQKPRLTVEQLQIVTAAQARLDEIAGEIGAQQRAAQQARQERATLAVDEDLLSAEPGIDTLRESKHAADAARADAAELGRDASEARAELGRLLGRLGLDGAADPLGAFAGCAVPDDRLADLNSLAGAGEQLTAERQKAEQAVTAAETTLLQARQDVEAGRVAEDRSGAVDASQVGGTRDQRDALWRHIRGCWLTGDAVPAEAAPSPAALAERYQESVAQADAAADELAASVGQLSQEQQREIAAAATARGIVIERRAALNSAQRAVDDIKARQRDWRVSWLAATQAAGLPDGLGSPGWRERAELLAAAQDAAEQLRELHRNRDAAAQTVAAWDTAAAALAADLGHDVAVERLAAWFTAIGDAYDRSKSNRNTADVHRRTETAATERLEQLDAERAVLEESLAGIAAGYGLRRDGLDALADRARQYQDAVAALAAPRDQLQATHPGMPLDELISRFADREPEQVKVDLDSAAEAAAAADEAVNTAQQAAVTAEQRLAELTRRTGADALRQELSQQTAAVLELVEDYAVTRLMHHLLTQELRGYLESHRNPVLDRAGSYLSRLTGGRYSRLLAEGEGTARALVVVGADGSDIAPTALSEGTAAQLYLALSLAGVLEVERERRAAGQETVPIMLDDVLMTFDDERAASALDLLAEIGVEQQIVLFTHHAAVRELAGSIAGTATVVSLDAPAALPG